MRLPTVVNNVLSPSAKKMFPKIRLGRRLKKMIKAKPHKHQFSCEKCEEQFPTWWEIWRHWKASGHKTPEQCRWCQKKTFTLQSHLCKQHWDMATMCSHCGQLFMFREDEARHASRHDSKEYRCFLCGRRRRSESLLRSHIYSHYIYEKYGCNICEKRFKKKKNLERHLKQIHFICQYCGNTCKSLEELKKHINTHDDLKCVFCQKVFSQKNRLKYHYQLRHGHQDFYRCSLCFQRFALKNSLLAHIKLKHNGCSKFSCKICAKPFLHWKNYVNHFESMHAQLSEVDNKFCCSFCDFKTDIKIKLQWHVEKTSGIGFFCKKCQIRLDCKGRFDKHMERHVGECVWTCDYCPRGFSSDNVLNHHLSMVHPEVVMCQNPRGFPCLEPGCNRYYMVSSSLARHVRRSHSNPSVHNTSHNFTISHFPKLGKVSNRQKKEEKEMVLKDKITLNNFQTECPAGKGYHHIMKPPNNMMEVNVYYCDICNKFWFTGEIQFQKHMTAHVRKVWEEECEDCNVMLVSPTEAVKHYVEDHLKVEFIQGS